MTSEVIRIFPKVSELNKILNKIECPEKDCSEVFQNTPNLSLHLLKTHGKDGSLKSGYGCKVAEYYCPEVGCKYCFNADCGNEPNSKLTNRFFTQFKYLKQHYIKVHLDKTFKCEKCNKGFPTESYRSRHYEVCGCKYTCSCGVVYSSLESLQTHARREKHSYIKENFKGQNNRLRKSSVSETPQNNNLHIVTIDGYQNNNEANNSCNVFKVPNDMNILIIHGIVKLESLPVAENVQSGNVTVSTQTDITSKRRKLLSPSKNWTSEKSVKKRTSKQTQTGEKRPKTTTETQTNNDNLLLEQNKIATKNNGAVNLRKRKKSMETQTSTSSSVPPVINTNNNNVINCADYYSKCCPSSPDCIRECKSCNEDEDCDSNNITQKDICLPQLWLNAENDGSCKGERGNSCGKFSADLNALETSKSILVSPLFDDNMEQRLDVSNSFSFCNRQQDFIREVNKESNSSCHIETQTDYDSSIRTLLGDYLSDFDNDILDQYTQTCDDILPDDMCLGLTNNETQTAWSLCDDPFISDVVNSETQTNSTFNACDYAT